MLCLIRGKQGRRIPMAPPQISNVQTRWFRFRRSGLIDSFKTPTDAARQLIGIQAQIPISAHLALTNRVDNVTLNSLKAAREQERKLIRMWGQRNTAHLYAADDWPLLHRWTRNLASIVASKLKQAGVEKAFNGLVSYFARRLERGEHVRFRDARSFKNYETIVGTKEQWMASVSATGSADWLIAAAAIMRLVRDGVVCHGPDDGPESTFVHRRHWLPELNWTEDESHILSTGAQRYLAAYGPATPKEMAAYFGLTLTEVTQWIGVARDKLIEVDRAGTRSLARAVDLEVLTERPPPGADWPVRLLHRFDPYLVGTVGIKDKDWLIDDDNINRVWRPGGHIEAVILDHGCVVGTWRFTRKASGLLFDIKPFKPWSQRLRREVIKGAKTTANFLEQEILDIEIG
jgi:hypothetical protein